MWETINSCPDYQISALFAALVIIFFAGKFISVWREESALHSKGEINHKLMRSVLDDQNNHNTLR